MNAKGGNSGKGGAGSAGSHHPARVAVDGAKGTVEQRTGNSQFRQAGMEAVERWAKHIGSTEPNKDLTERENQVRSPIVTRREQEARRIQKDVDYRTKPLPRGTDEARERLIDAEQERLTDVFRQRFGPTAERSQEFLNDERQALRKNLSPQEMAREVAEISKRHTRVYEMSLVRDAAKDPDKDIGRDRD